MKRNICIYATIAVLALGCIVVVAQTQKPVQMPAEQAVELAGLLQESNKLATDNAPLITQWQAYTNQQQAIQGRINQTIMRGAMAAGLTLPQLDASELRPDSKGGWHWLPKPKPSPLPSSAK